MSDPRPSLLCRAIVAVLWLVLWPLAVWRWLERMEMMNSKPNAGLRGEQ